MDPYRLGFETTDEPVYEYGSMAANQPAPEKLRNREEVDIQLHDFKGVNFKDPLIPGVEPTQASTDKKAAYQPTSFNSLLSSHSSDQFVDYSDPSFSQNDSWLRHPKVRENWRVVLGSGFLFLLGIVLVLTGLSLAFTPLRGYHCLIIGVIGLLCVIPGGYHFIYIYCAALGRPGYEFDKLPVLR